MNEFHYTSDADLIALGTPAARLELSRRGHVTSAAHTWAVSAALADEAAAAEAARTFVRTTFALPAPPAPVFVTPVAPVAPVKQRRRRLRIRIELV